jgi:hypothetical protein
MIKKPFIRCSLLFFTVILFSFRNTDKTSGHLLTSASDFTARQNHLDTGRIVNMDSIQTCLANYKKLMKSHGFSNPGGQPFNKTIAITDQLTTGESFSGKDLRDWLDATADSYSRAGQTLSIRIEFGVYDMTYLNTYEPNAAKRAKSNNRIAIFLIPYDASSGTTLEPHAMAATSTTAGSGGAYDFGGLQP